MRSIRRSSLIVLAAALALPSVAAAQSPRPALTLPQGKVSVTATLEVNLSADAVAEPLSIAPDVSYGLLDELTVSLIHSSYAINGFRAAAGRGLCVTGKDGGCPNIYDDVGVTAQYSLLRGDLAVAAEAGLIAMSLDAGFYDAKLGARLRWKSGKVTAVVLPNVLLALTKRDEPAPAVSNQDSLWIPLVVSYQVIEPLSLGAAVGFKTPLENVGDSWLISAGVVAGYKLAPSLSLGASLIFGRLVGASAYPDDAKGLDYRWLQMWLTWTR